jgi:hypothetical protein
MAPHACVAVAKDASPRRTRSKRGPAGDAGLRLLLSSPTTAPWRTDPIWFKTSSGRANCSTRAFLRIHMILWVPAALHSIWRRVYRCSKSTDEDLVPRRRPSLIVHGRRPPDARFNPYRTNLPGRKAERLALTPSTALSDQLGARSRRRSCQGCEHARDHVCDLGRQLFGIHALFDAAELDERGAPTTVQSGPSRCARADQTSSGGGSVGSPTRRSTSARSRPRSSSSRRRSTRNTPRTRRAHAAPALPVRRAG